MVVKLKWQENQQVCEQTGSIWEKSVLTYSHVMMTLSFSEPLGFRLTVIICGWAENKSFVSQFFVPRSTDFPSPFTSTACQAEISNQIYTLCVKRHLIHQLSSVLLFQITQDRAINKTAKEKNSFVIHERLNETHCIAINYRIWLDTFK